MTHQSSHVFPIRKGVYSNDTSKFPCVPIRKGVYSNDTSKFPCVPYKKGRIFT